VLQGELGQQLIRPEGRGIEITEKGLEIYRMSSTLLDEYRRFQQGAARNEPAKAKLRIATFEVFSSYFLSAFLAKELPYSNALLLELTPGGIERAVLEGLVEYGLTYLPNPDPALQFIEVGSFRMGIFGRPEWTRSSFAEWAFAVPTTELRIHSLAEDSLDMWPKGAPRRETKYEFELLETALLMASSGHAVVHAPDFIVRLHNERVKASLKLERMPDPAGYRVGKAVKVYLVAKKNHSPEVLERKLAKFFRSLR